jgi:hypothetical protein
MVLTSMPLSGMYLPPSPYPPKKMYMPKSSASQIWGCLAIRCEDGTHLEPEFAPGVRPNEPYHWFRNLLKFTSWLVAHGAAGKAEQG